jgi:hypothetical protein
VRRLGAALLLLLIAACGSPEPDATPQPTARSLLPPTDEPSPTPSPSPSSDGGDASSDGAGAETAQDDAAPASAESAASSSPRPTKKPRDPGISGQVLAGGQPVTDAQVTISGSGYSHNTTTSSQGRFQSAAPPGTYTVAASSPSASGCGTQTVTVPKDAVARVTITCNA